MKKILFILTLNCLLLAAQSLSGQFYEMTRYADDSGLPSRIVRDVIQDHEGFIWVAGNNGLYKFDGQEFKPYLASLKDTVGLRDNRINAVLQTSGNQIWVGTPKGLHVLENDSITYVRLIENPTVEQEYVLNLFEDKDQNLWVGTYGGLFMVENSRAAIHFLSEERNLAVAKGVVWRVTQDNRGKIWIAAKDGPYLLGPEDNFSFRKLNVKREHDITGQEAAFFGYLHYNDSLVVVESDNGLLKGVIENDTLLNISKFLSADGNEVDGFSVERTIIDKEGNIWVGTAKNSFKKFKLKNGRLIEQEIISKNGLLDISGNTKSVYEDSQGNIWLANTNGLYKLSRNVGHNSTFPPRYIKNCLEDFYGVYDIIEDKGGHLWITTPTKLYRLKKSDLLKGKCPEDFLLFKDENMQLSRNLFIDSQYRLWIGADGGLFVAQLDEKHSPGKFVRYNKSHGLPHNWSYDIFEEDKNNFWVGNYAGLIKLTFEDGNLENPKIKVYESEVDRSDALVNSQAVDIEEDEKGNIWFGTFSGLSRLVNEEESGSFENYTYTFGDFQSLSNNSIKKIFKDDQGRLWIATQRGLNLYEPDKDRFVQFGNDEGLPSEYVLGIQEDSKGFLWIATTNGVIKTQFNDQNQSFTNIEHFTSQNGLADNIPYRNSILIDEDDNVFIGSREGVSIFKNSNNSEVNVDFKMAITGIESTQEKKQGFKSVSSRIGGNEIVLSHFENSVKLNYAVLDFTNPKYNKYRHKFLPVNKDWIETGSVSELTYYNLASGEYQLILDGSNSRGTWSKNPIQLKLTIKPPFWKSNWAYLLYLLLGAALLRFFYLLRIRKKVRELEQETLLEKALVEEREQLRQENAADFHDELGSKVTKISLFLTLAERSLNQNDDPLPWFAKIRDNIKGLSGSFRDLLWVIDPKKDSLNDTFLRLKDFGEDLFNTNDINFRTNGLDVAHTDLLLSPQTKKQVVLIFKEAMTNCLKYAESGQVDLTLESNGAFSSLELRDNGVGFDVAIKSKGRGLKNMVTRAEKINASLKITSSEKGTTVHLSRIPHTSDRFQLQDS
ncbi:MAG: ligand-binding sensor domain-containing protein [Aurantibacter sp.]